MSSHALPILAERSTLRDVRRRNRTVIASHLYFAGAASRRELTQITGLSTGAVTAVTAELVAEGVLEEAGSVASNGGRPRVMLRVVADRKVVLGVDIGEDRIRVGLFALDLTVLDQHIEDFDEDELLPQLVVRRVHAAVRLLMERNDVPWSKVLGVGVGMLGIVDGTGGSAVVHVPTIGWADVPIEAMLREGWGAPVFVDNGARALGQVEMWFGAGRGAQSAAVVLYGTGVGAAFVTQSGNEPAFASEWGHTVLVFEGAACRCGSRGCLEAYVGAGALVERFRDAEPGRLDAGLSPEDAFDALVQDSGGDNAAFRIVAGAAHRLGASLGGLVNALRPERILLGGYAGARIGPEFLEIVRKSAARTALAPWAGSIDVRLCSYGRDGVVTGGAALPVARWLDLGAPAGELV